MSWQSIALLAVVFWYLTHRDNVYLIDFTTFDAPDDWKLSYEQLVEAMKLQGCYTEDSLTFMEKMLKNSGTGPKTAWPPVCFFSSCFPFSLFFLMLCLLFVVLGYCAMFKRYSC